MSVVVITVIEPYEVELASTGDMGYPSTVQLDGPWMLTMWYERLKEQTQAVLKCARWRLDDPSIPTR